ncbi:ATP-binding cassette domain-containing protein [Streptosporangium sp. NPDC051022]|uniref:ATP-binding cassette domain-containing protein n=1 Tax=Streptosporangium sp. NPDC051022 TaxID=3155752 RepID=UPI0034404212
MIEVRNLTKRHGSKLAVDNLSLHVMPGQVTGFLGPNGAGKSTTIRAVLGLDTPTSGQALVGGRQYTSLLRPLYMVGALLDADAAHIGRSAYSHLAILARTNGIGRRRVADVLEMVGLSEVSYKRVSGFSLGMKQRLGIAAALLGDPGILILDEPVNGLDPEGIRWIRELLRSLAAEGRTVFISSHAMSEMALTADRVIIIGRGRLITEASVSELLVRFHRDVLVKTPREGDLTRLLVAHGAIVRPDPAGGLSVSADRQRAGRDALLDSVWISELAAAHAIPLHEITPRSASLEEAFMELTDDSTDYKATGRRA